MAALPTFVNIGTKAAAAGAVAVPLPASLEVGDALFLCIETANQAVAVSTPNGGIWTEATASPQGIGTAGGTLATRLTVFWSRYNGSQGNPTISDSGNHQIAWIIAFRGVRRRGVPWNMIVGATQDGGGAAFTKSLPSGTTTKDNCLLLLIMADDFDGAGGRHTAWTNADLANITERSDDGDIIQNGGGIGIATGEKATAGAFTNTTGANSTALRVAGQIVIALEPDEGAPLEATIPAPKYGRLLGAVNRFLFLAQAAAGGTLFTHGPADTVALTEALTRQAQKALGDAVGLTEAFTRQSAKIILETVVLTEALARHSTRPLAETLSLAEDLQAVKLVALDLPETLSLSEQLAIALEKRSDLGETLVLTEQLARETGKSLADTVSLAENLTAIKAIFKDLAETVMLTENLARVIQKAAGLAEAVGLAEQLAHQTNRTVAETLSLTENLAAIKVAQAEVADVLALSETVARLTARVLEETVGLTEAQQREVRKMLAETVGFTEQLVATLLHQAAVSDTVVLTEALARQIGKAVQETLGLTETRLVQVARRIEETVSLQEVLDVLFVPSTPALAQVVFLSPGRQLVYASLSRERIYVAPGGPR